MSRVVSEFDYTKLSVAERIILVQDIWDSIAAETGGIELTEAQRQELHRRIADHEKHPEEAIPWDQVKAEIAQRLNDRND